MCHLFSFENRNKMSSTRIVYLENMLAVEYVGVTRRYDLHIYLSTFIYMPDAEKTVPATVIIIS